MCGIFGLVLGPGHNFSSADIKAALDALFRLSETRGKEAAGVAFLTQHRIDIHKDALPASQMLRTPAYQRFIGKIISGSHARFSSPLAIIGHARLVTNGLQAIDANNQPVCSGRSVVVHNGIVVNDNELWQKFPELKREADVDTEVIGGLVDMFRGRGAELATALRLTFDHIRGEASLAMLFADLDKMVLATNTGSLFVGQARDGQALFFASEDYIAHQVTSGQTVPAFAGSEVVQLRAGMMQIIDLGNLTSSILPIIESSAGSAAPSVSRDLATMRTVEDKAVRNEMRRAALRRCTRCILPETMPFIAFDAEGVCNYCRNHSTMRVKGRRALEDVLARHRRADGKADCIVAFSGGRDSSYGLHLLRREFGMTPIAYTYDWGMVTDLGRRNQARMCGALGIEHLWVSADIRSKRANIRRNVEAWMRRPDLGMIPLFMAGDKQFFWHANQAMKRTGNELMIFCMNNYERTDFKAGFAGVGPARHDERTFTLGSRGKLNLALYYGKQHLLNPAYLNRSIVDTLLAFASYYVIDRNYLYLFDYVEWDEEESNKVLLDTYDWEIAKDTTTTWRIGDGTAPLYNYIYRTVAGFSEFETFRSNQIRDGIMTRDAALATVEQESRPRWSSIREYTQMINVDFDELVRVIDSIPKLYSTAEE